MTSDRTVQAQDALHLRLSTVKIPRDGTTISFRADEASCKRLARQLAIADVEVVSADLTATTWRRDGVRVKGVVKARIVQESVVTLELVTQQIREDLNLTFVPEGSPLAMPSQAREIEISVDPEAEDPPEPFAGHDIELGPYIAEVVSLALDPYPRESDATFKPVVSEPDVEQDEPGAFSVLKELLPRDGGTRKR